jgi:ABC-2 type transport system ATP-binding protein
VVIGGGRILAADTVDTITAGTDVTVVTETPHTADLIGLLATHGISADVDGHRLRIQGTTRHEIARLAFDHRIRLDELTETTSSLEDILLDLTNATAEFASA